MTGDTTSPTSREFVISRTFDAPRALVFQAFAEAERLAQWWGPKGFEVHVSRFEFRPGGIFHYRMAHADGNEMWGRFIYREIVDPERIVFVTSFSDPDGNLVRGPFSPTLPLEFLYTVTLAAQDGKTTLTLVGTPINATAAEHETFQSMHDSMQQGFGSALDQLAAHLAKAHAAT